MLLYTLGLSGSKENEARRLKQSKRRMLRIFTIEPWCGLLDAACPQKVAQGLGSHSKICQSSQGPALKQNKFFASLYPSCQVCNFHQIPSLFQTPFRVSNYFQADASIPSQRPEATHSMASQSSKTYAQRGHAHQHPVARKLFEIAELKKSNLVVSADLEDTESLLKCADGSFGMRPT